MSGDAGLPARFRRRAVTPDEACLRIVKAVLPLEAETVPLPEAWGRALASDVTAPHAYPPFRRSAMDGYAVRAEDLPSDRADGSAPAVLRVMESVPAGKVPSRPVGPGQASRVMTGAMLPEGADTVVMLEMTDAGDRPDADTVRIGKAVPRGRNVSDIGSEIKAGDRIAEEGRRIGPGETALLAAFGLSRVSVVRRPRVGVLSTGSELLEVHEPLAPGKIRNTNAWMLAGMIRDAGGEPVLYGRVPDESRRAQAAIYRGLSECDLLLTTGGVSVGDHDVLAEVVSSWRGEVLFDKVAMRPGSPTTAAVSDGKLLIALSGNPGACFVGFHLFAAPAIRAMLRCAQPLMPKYPARCAEAWLKINAYPRYIRSRTEFREGSLWARPAGNDQSGLMATIAGTDALMVVPPLKEGLEAGAWVQVMPLREGGWL
jgi:molybdopterin molybdotransferase